MNIVLTGFCGYVALAVIVFCIFYTMARAGMDLHDQWMLRKWKKNNKDKQQLIDDACEWLYDKLYTRANGAEHYVASKEKITQSEFVEQFRKALEE